MNYPTVGLRGVASRNAEMEIQDLLLEFVDLEIRLWFGQGNPHACPANATLQAAQLRLPIEAMLPLLE